jgi:hypothetical protein
MTPSARRPVRMSEPEKFDGTDKSKYKTFLNSLELYFNSDLVFEEDPLNKVYTAISYLTRPPQAHFQILALQEDSTLLNWDKFKRRFTEAYGDIDAREMARNKLRLLDMTNKDLNTYISTFLSLTAAAEMENDILLFLYKSGLSHPILNKLATIPLKNILTTWDLFRNYILRQENHYQQTIAL